MSLDPARKTARVTRAIAERLAAVSKALEEQEHDAEEVAMFLMRCLFTMFAEDVELLPKASFRDLLERCEQDPSRLLPMVSQLWEAMDNGDFAIARGEGAPLQRRVLQDPHRAASGPRGDRRTAPRRVVRLARVDPSIFGTLLEQALEQKNAAGWARIIRRAHTWSGLWSPR